MKFTPALVGRLAALAGLTLSEEETGTMALELTRRREGLRALDELAGQELDAAPRMPE